MDQCYALFAERPGNIVVQDDPTEWIKHNKQQFYGKFFPIDYSDETILQMFFDEKIAADNENCVNSVAPVDVKTGKNLSPSKLIWSKILVPVDLLEVIEFENYFTVKFQDRKNLIG